jgi:rhodanese-related sulfurtransferase
MVLITNGKFKTHIMKLISSICLLIFCVFIISCNNNPDSFETVDDMVASAKAATKSIDGKKLKVLIDKGGIQIIDCREENVYKEGHIKGAVNIPRGLLEFSGKISNRRLTTLVFGNEKGSAALAAQTLKKLKYFDCYWIDCNWEKWAEHNPELTEKGMPGGIVEEKKVETSGGGCGE